MENERDEQQESAGVRAIAFAGDDCVALGDLRQVAAAVKERADRDPDAIILVFDAANSARIELDLRGSVDDVLGRLPVAPAEESAEPRTASPGRPKLGVVAREVTLLPRHWEWLNRQPGGASVTLRKLVEEARRAGAQKERIRKAQEVSYRFLTVMAGDRPGFEEATRALFAGDRERFTALIAPWPADIRDHAGALAAGAFVEAAE
jgi:hypothetical protein